MDVLPENSTTIERIPTLDGIRGIAILAVLCFHYAPDLAMPNRMLEWSKKLFQAGWLGVDLFFVLSGFLITRILLQAKGKPNFFKNFYARRTLRIFPLYFGVLTLLFVGLPALGLVHSTQAQTVIANQWWSWTYLTNIGMFVQGFESFFSPEITVIHFWSLAVEEHFYLLWPLVVWLTPLRRLPLVCIVCILSAFALRSAWAFSPYRGLNFTSLMPCRMDALACGAWLACMNLARLKDAYLWLVGGATALFLAVVMQREKGLWLDSPTMQSLGITLAVIGFTCAIAIACRLPHGSKLGTILARGPLPFFGKYSYGIYVIHGLTFLPVASLISSQELIDATGSIPVGAALYWLVQTSIATVLAVGSWHLFEKRFLALKRKFT